LPPSLREWLPEGHLAWFVIDAVAQLDLAAFYAAYRADGHGRAAHDPAMMVALLLYGYAIGERSSRRIERRCVEDVACRVIAANQVPDHTTIARFRQRHEAALAELFGEVLALCAEAGLAGVGVIAIDGMKVHATASQHANRDDERACARDPRRGRRGRCRRGRAVRRRSRRRVTAGAGHQSGPGGGGWVRPSGDSMTSAPRRQGRSRAHGASGCGNPSAAPRRSTGSNARPTPTMRATGRAV
jgi:transposase